MRTKTLVIVALAFAAGGTCPSDVNNDGTVGIQDFLQVLGAWGPCPNATVIAMDTDDTDISVPSAAIRQWSDGLLEIGLELVGGPPPTWIWGAVLSSPHIGLPVDVSMTWIGLANCNPNPPNNIGAGRFRITRQYADGYAEYIRGRACINQDHTSATFSWDHDWYTIPSRGTRP